MPHALRFVYSYVEPDSLMNPPPEAFVVVCSSRGPIGVGKFEYPKWHKKKKDDILAELGLAGRIEYGEVSNYGDESKNWLSDFEYGRIIELRATGLSMRKIQEKVHRSTDTIKRHIDLHNESVTGTKRYCVKCRRIKSGLSGLDV